MRNLNTQFKCYCPRTAKNAKQSTGSFMALAQFKNANSRAVANWNTTAQHLLPRGRCTSGSFAFDSTLEYQTLDEKTLKYHGKRFLELHNSYFVWTCWNANVAALFIFLFIFKNKILNTSKALYKSQKYSKVI